MVGWVRAEVWIGSWPHHILVLHLMHSAMNVVCLHSISDCRIAMHDGLAHRMVMLMLILLHLNLHWMFVSCFIFMIHWHHFTRRQGFWDVHTVVVNSLWVHLLVMLIYKQQKNLCLVSIQYSWLDTFFYLKSKFLYETLEQINWFSRKNNLPWVD